MEEGEENMHWEAWYVQKHWLLKDPECSGTLKSFPGLGDGINNGQEGDSWAGAVDGSQLVTTPH